MLKKSYLFFLLSMLPLWCIAFSSQPGEQDISALNQHACTTDQHFIDLSIHSSISESYHNDPAPARGQVPAENNDSENTDEPEEKEEKNESREDQDQCTQQQEYLNSFTLKGYYLILTFAVVSAFETTPFYILFHSWKSYLI